MRDMGDYVWSLDKYSPTARMRVYVRHGQHCGGGGREAVMSLHRRTRAIFY